MPPTQPGAHVGHPPDAARPPDPDPAHQILALRPSDPGPAHQIQAPPRVRRQGPWICSRRLPEPEPPSLPRALCRRLPSLDLRYCRRSCPDRTAWLRRSREGQATRAPCARTSAHVCTNKCVCASVCPRDHACSHDDMQECGCRQGAHKRSCVCAHTSACGRACPWECVLVHECDAGVHTSV